MPFADIARPTIPIRIAIAMEIGAHIEAIRLETLIFSVSSIAMNLTRICGIPKYPSPQAAVDIIVRNPYFEAVPVDTSYDA